MNSKEILNAMLQMSVDADFSHIDDNLRKAITIERALDIAKKLDGDKAA